MYVVIKHIASTEDLYGIISSICFVLLLFSFLLLRLLWY